LPAAFADLRCYLSANYLLLVSLLQAPFLLAVVSQLSANYLLLMSLLQAAFCLLLFLLAVLLPKLLSLALLKTSVFCQRPIW
jgi:hypothetical protein